MEQQQKDKLILALLYHHQDKDFLEHEIREALENKLTAREIDICLEGLCESGIVSFVSAKDSEGAELPFLRYRLSSNGFRFFDNLLANKNRPAKEDKNKIASTNTKAKQTKELNEPDNPFAIIFKNGYAFQFFLELKKETVNERTKVADYAFIYHKMKNKTFYAINKIVTQPAFIDFLNEQYKVGIKGKILPIKLPKNKEKDYEKLFEKYKTGLISKN